MHKGQSENMKCYPRQQCAWHIATTQLIVLSTLANEYLLNMSLANRTACRQLCAYSTLLDCYSPASRASFGNETVKLASSNCEHMLPKKVNTACKLRTHRRTHEVVFTRSCLVRLKRMHKQSRTSHATHRCSLHKLTRSDCEQPCLLTT